MSLARDQSLTVVITGKKESVLMARKLITEKLQTQVNCLDRNAALVWFDMLFVVR